MVILEASIEATSDHLEKLEDVSRCSCTFQRLCMYRYHSRVRKVPTVSTRAVYMVGIYPPLSDHTELNAIHTSCLYSCFGFPIPKRAAAILAYIYRYFCMPALTRTMVPIHVVLDLGPSNGQILYFQPTRVMRN